MRTRRLDRLLRRRFQVSDRDNFPVKPRDRDFVRFDHDAVVFGTQCVVAAPESNNPASRDRVEECHFLAALCNNEIDIIHLRADFDRPLRRFQNDHGAHQQCHRPSGQLCPGERAVSV